MSYNCTIAFKKLEPAALYSFLHTFKTNTTEHLEDIAENNYIFSPFMKKYFFKTDTIELTPELYEETATWARMYVFNHRFFYMPSIKLLGVYSVHKSLEYLFDTVCYFQNSCDQDYPFEDWNGIDVFEKIEKKWQSASEEELLKVLCQKDYFDEEKLTPEKLDYYRRSAVYDEIWKMVEHTLYDDSSILYLSLYGAYESDTIRKFICYCKDRGDRFIRECKQKAGGEQS